MILAPECCKAVCRVSRPLKKIRFWSSAKAEIGKMKKRKENGGMGTEGKNGIHKEKSQPRSFTPSIRMQSQVNEIREALFRNVSKPSLPCCTISTISISTAERIHPLCFMLPIISTSVPHIAVVPDPFLSIHVCLQYECERTCTLHKFFSPLPVTECEKHKASNAAVIRQNTNTH